MKRRALLAVAVPAGVLTATCAGAGSDSAPKPNTALRADVTVPFLQTSGQAEQGMVNQVVEKWKAKNPRGPQVEFVISTGDVVEKFSTMLAGGTPPALVSMDSTQGVRFADQGDMV